MPLIDPLSLLLILGALAFGMTKGGPRRSAVGIAALLFLVIGLTANYAPAGIAYDSDLQFICSMILYLCWIGLLGSVAFLLGSGGRALVTRIYSSVGPDGPAPKR